MVRESSRRESGGLEERGLMGDHFHSDMDVTLKARPSLSASPHDPPSLPNISSCSSSTETIFPTPPDGGYGWVIVFAAFLIHVIADGISFSFGVLFPSIQEHYNAQKAESAMVGSIFMALPLLAGPLASALTDHYGFRFTTMAGGVAAGTGFLLSRFATSLALLYVSFGVLSGLGLAIVFNTAIVAVTYYFERHRALATGLTVCGTGIGTFVFPPLCDLILVHYNWQGALLILGGILFQLIVCGALLRDLEWPEDSFEYKSAKFLRRLERKSRAEFAVVSGAGSTREPSLALFPNHHPTRTTSLILFPTYIASGSGADAQASDAKPNLPVPTSARSKSVAAKLASQSPSTPSPPPAKRRVRTISQSETALMGEYQVYEDSSEEDAKRLRAHTCASGGNSLENGERPMQRSLSEAQSCASPTKRRMLRSKQRALDWVLEQNLLPPHIMPPSPVPDTSEIPETEEVEAMKPRKRRGRSTLSNGSVFTPRTHIHHLRSAHNPSHHRITARFVSAPALMKPRKKRTGLSWREQLRGWLREAGQTVLHDCRLLTSPAFDLFLLRNLPEYAMSQLGIKEAKSSLLVSCMGVCSTAGMIAYGLLADRKWMNNTLFYGVSMVICGVVVLLFPFIPDSYALYTSLCCLYGFFISANYTLTSVILLELLTLRDFANAYGIVCLVQGLGNLVGPPLAGFLYDKTGHYLATFVTGGAGIITSGLIVVGILFLGRTGLQTPAHIPAPVGSLSSHSPSHSPSPPPSPRDFLQIRRGSRASNNHNGYIVA